MQKHKYNVRQPQNWFSGAFYMVAAAICVVLGIIGLIVPVIPGVIFLAIAIVFLARVSTRMDRWVKSSRFMSMTQSRMDSMAQLGWPDKARMVFWYAGYGLLQVGEFSARQIRKLRRSKN